MKPKCAVLGKVIEVKFSPARDKYYIIINVFKTIKIDQAHGFKQADRPYAVLQEEERCVVFEDFDD